MLNKERSICSLWEVPSGLGLARKRRISLQYKGTEETQSRGRMRPVHAKQPHWPHQPHTKHGSQLEKDTQDSTSPLPFAWLWEAVNNFCPLASFLKYYSKLFKNTRMTLKSIDNYEWLFFLLLEHNDVKALLKSKCQHLLKGSRIYSKDLYLWLFKVMHIPQTQINIVCQ